MSRMLTAALALCLLAGCSKDQTPPSSDGPLSDTRPAVDAAADRGPDNNLAPDAAIDGPPVDLPLPDLGNWPAGFTPQPKNVPTGLLCTIPADYVAKGGDPVNPPCDVEADSFSTTDPSVMPSGLKVVTWNVEYGKKSSEVIQALTTNSNLLDADVLMLQEVPRLDNESSPPKINLARDIAQTLKMNYVFGVEWDRRLKSTQGGEHGLAILSRYPLGNVYLMRHTAVYNHYAEKKDFGGRATLAAEIVVAGQRLRFYNAHLATRDLTGLGRAKQGGEILKDAALSKQPPARVLGGDLNTFICNPQILTCNKPPAAEPVIQNILNDGWADLLPSFNSWTQLGIGFFPQRLDWLFAKGVTPVSAQVLQSIKAADHVPMLSVLTVP